MRKFAIFAIILTLLALPSATVYAASPPDAGKSHVISVLGVAQIQGRDAFVDILAVVPPGADEQEVAANVLREQGARPVDRKALESAAYTTEGWVWPQFFDSESSNNFVIQNYNPLDDPNGGSGETALTNSENTWTGVPSSSFEFQYGGQTIRYPSLVKESPGPQYTDRFNDVGWAQLGGSTLGVTWYMTSPPYETDMALNINFSWVVSSGGYDKETVFLHENGHVVGLGHSADSTAVMYYRYGGVQQTLTSDDIAGASALYPMPTPPGSIVGTVTASMGGAIVGATVSADTGQSTTTDGNGAYTLTSVPAGSRMVTASATGYSSSSQPVTVNSGETSTANFILSPVVTTSDFTLSVSPTSKSVRAGQPAKYSVILAAVNGYNYPVTVSVSGLPPAATATLNPTDPVIPTSSGTTIKLTVTTSRQTPANTYLLIITGIGQDLQTHSTSVTLIVK